MHRDKVAVAVSVESKKPEGCKKSRVRGTPARPVDRPARRSAFAAFAGPSTGPGSGREHERPRIGSIVTRPAGLRLRLRLEEGSR